MSRRSSTLAGAAAAEVMFHVNVLNLQHSNFSSGLALWDHVHGTACRASAQDRITIGLPQEKLER